jgi:transmembrane sensor
MSSNDDFDPRSDAELGEQAAEWLLRLEQTADDPDGGYPNEHARNTAFFDWLALSPGHLRTFLETIEMHRRMRMIDADRMIQVEALIRQRADVIPLRKEKAARMEHRPPVSTREDPEHTTTTTEARGRAPLRVAAAVTLCILGAGGYLWSQAPHVYTTNVGEQRSTKLEDGSFIYLNTDSKVEVDLTKHARNIRLVRGEALFIVEHDSSRPFTVAAGGTSVRALGTQFNVRRREQGADVAVVEGSVQVTAIETQSVVPPRKLGAGEDVRVEKGQFAAGAGQSVADTLAWRQRRLVFHDASLADVAAEFNRYNRTKIRVEGEDARQILLSGIFDADRPQALMLYAASNADLAVEPVGNDWVIRER